jgi:hypothetical protein
MDILFRISTLFESEFCEKSITKHSVQENTSLHGYSIYYNLLLMTYGRFQT